MQWATYRGAQVGANVPGVAKCHVFRHIFSFSAFPDDTFRAGFMAREAKIPRCAPIASEGAIVVSRWCPMGCVAQSSGVF